MPAWNKIKLDKDKLEYLYIKEKLSISQIAKKFSLSKTPIHRMLHEYMIPVRTSKEASIKVSATRKQLTNWYLKDKFSMFQIAEKLGCTHSAIVYKLRKFGIKSRGHLGLTKPIKLTKDGFEYLYYKRGLSLKKISNIAHCSESGLERRFKTYNLKSRTTQNRTTRIKKFDFSGDLIEKAYLIGFRLGDLNIMKRVSVTQVRCSSSVYAQIRLIKQLFSKYSSPKIRKFIDYKFNIPKWDIVFLVNKSFDFLIPKQDKIPNWIQRDKNLFFSFLAGYSDAEGSFLIRKGKPKNKIGFGIYEVGSQQKNIIIQIWENLSKYNIQVSYPIISKKAGYTQSNGMRNNKDFWHLSTARKVSVWKLIQEIKPFIKHPNKIKQLNHVKQNVNLRLINSPYHPVAS
jgi:predicted DNA-binding protein YlxM (UPF0122 family)